MPKYYVRTLYDDFAIGSINAVNPAIIVSGLILLIPVLGRFSTVGLMIAGMSISAFSLVFMAIPIEWYYLVPGIVHCTLPSGYSALSSCPVGV